jgi:dTDP-4-amino-4,6-dideoxygalactose transaminase
MRVPLFDLAAQEATVSSEVLSEIAQVACDGTFVLGPRVAAFERWLATECGVSHAVGVASGTDALELGLRALGVHTGDAVVTPAVSFVAAAEAIARIGAVPVFCDVDTVTMNVSPRTVADAIGRGRKAGREVRALVPVHLFGLCPPAGALRDLAVREGLAVLDDAAQALGARDGDGRPAGSSGDAATFSFFPTKNLGAWGDGGAVVTSRDDVAARVRKLRVHGASAPHVHDEVGCNSRLDEVQAAVLLAKARRLATWQSSRIRLAARYRAELAPFPLVLPWSPAPPAAPGWHAFVVRSDRRDGLGTWLRDHGVDARVYYPKALHEQACFSSLDRTSLPVAEEVCRTALALPIFPTMSDAVQTYVIEQVASFFRR